MDITSERVSIPLTGGGPMGGFLARPKSGGPFPAVLVFMEIFGVNSHIRDVAERVAREGYAALAPDYFHRTGPGVEYGYDEAGMAAGPAVNLRRPNQSSRHAGAAAAAERRTRRCSRQPTR